ncbi:FxDxF family PEP-CTERM protein [uncultured Sphingomonas sp.]|uniref:FxDxF family PEP-CTERM protein n=1 Tax=uncultured Sphingomonas sp. TaxID=158754 RepID=UPI0025D1E482|nr:FxDxF family PEP-CTERM protein [uncultured Sphingomonas sp.]
MKKIFGAAVVAAAFAMSTPAMAATEIVLGPTGSQVQFGDFTITGLGSATNQFADYYFTVPSSGIVSASGTATISLATNSSIKLTSIVLNGVTALATLRADGSAYDAAINNVATIANPQTLRVNYDVMNVGRATGTVSWTSSAVPEPGTWALMILGFGVVGYAMRRRTSVRFAQAI